LKVGDRVFTVNWGNGRHNGDDVPVVGGGFAEYSLVNASKVAIIPDGVSFEEAAAISLTGSTAYQSLYEELNVPKGADAKVLVLGGSGGVGQCAVQLIKYYGGKVITTCSTRTLPFVTKLEPDKIINYGEHAWEEDPEVQGIDFVFDTVGTPGSFEKAKRILKPTGGFLSIANGEAGLNPKAHPPLSYAALFCLRNSVDTLECLIDLVAKKKLKVFIDEEFPFTKEGIVQIFKKQGSGKSIGKNILRITSVI